ncbi:MAG: ABC transporter substrate-binding protein [Oscillospiraceae bacterium]|nr:ABC transporter substrate-binding protein [Oscillospiraceae bacterium]
MKKQVLKKLTALSLTVLTLLSLAACGQKTGEGNAYKVGICSYVDDASLNQINENIQSRLKEIGQERGVTFEIAYDNPNADTTVMNQIIQSFLADKVDLMVGIATPVAMAMEAATEDDPIPVIFSAVSDPVGALLVDSLEAPGGNLTGTSDYLDTNTILELMLALDPDMEKVGLLYDPGQDSSTAPIAHAKEYLAEKNIEVVERTGTTASEVLLAAQALVADGVDAVFTPTDNTVMKAYLAVYETFLEARIPHYTGADSFALNGAFLGYGVDYAALGRETADMIASVLLDGADPAALAVKTFDNGTATINTETCAALGYDYDEVAALFAPLSDKVQPITTAEEFGDLEG